MYSGAHVFNAYHVDRNRADLSLGIRGSYTMYNLH